MKKMLIAWLVCAGAWNTVAGESPELLGAKALIEKAQADGPEGPVWLASPSTAKVSAGDNGYRHLGYAFA